MTFSFGSLSDMSLFTPDDYLSSVVLIDPGSLFEKGYRVVLLDLDNTLLPRDTHILPAEVKAWVAELKAHGLRPCLFSNNWHGVVLDYARELDIPAVNQAYKPFPVKYARALEKVGWVKGEKVMAIGDQIFTDVLGAKISGYDAILVAPQAKKDLWYTLLLRRIERLIMGVKKPRS